MTVVDYVVWIVIILTLAFAIGSAIHFHRHRNDIAGFIIVDRYDPDGPHLFLELSEDVETLCEGYTAVFGIIVRDPSQD